MVYISKKQKLAMDLVDGLVREFDVQRWFVKEELPGITLHSVDALVSKGYLEVRYSEGYGMPYYRRLKELETDLKLRS